MFCFNVIFRILQNTYLVFRKLIASLFFVYASFLVLLLLDLEFFVQFFYLLSFSL